MCSNLQAKQEHIARGSQHDADKGVMAALIADACRQCGDHLPQTGIGKRGRDILQAVYHQNCHDRGRKYIAQILEHLRHLPVAAKDQKRESAQSQCNDCRNQNGQNCFHDFFASSAFVFPSSQRIVIIRMPEARISAGSMKDLAPKRTRQAIAMLRPKIAGL